MSIFCPTDILVPEGKDFNKWSVVACDQYSSNPEYWDRVEKYVGDAASTLRLILPEVKLGEGDVADRVKKINSMMEEYCDKGVFCEYKNAFIYVERTFKNGAVRKGIIGAIDLEHYEYVSGAKSLVRPTEATVIERIPPRIKIRQDALLELPHILLLCDDEKKILVEYFGTIKEQLKQVYDFGLMEDGGHISGWLLDEANVALFNQRLEEYTVAAESKYNSWGKEAIIFAVGDGNHSLATAKACYENKKQSIGETALYSNARYALVELGNIYDESLVFEAIHRVVTNTDAQKLIDEVKTELASETGVDIKLHTKGAAEVVTIGVPEGKLVVEVLQKFLDSYLKNNDGDIDYIHGEEDLRELAEKDNSVGFLLPAMNKGDLFDEIVKNGVLPRKTFSMGEANDKRYYLEARKIK